MLRLRLVKTPDAEDPNAVDGLPKSGIGVYLTPTKKKRKTRNGTPTNQLAQSWCKICSIKTSHACNGCLEMIPMENMCSSATSKVDETALQSTRH
jgi:hypothetical protein